jgi:hypothetical protein
MRGAGSCNVRAVCWELHDEVFIIRVINQITECEMGGACNTHDRDEKWVQLENLKGRDHSREVGIDKRLIVFHFILRK